MTSASFWPSAREGTTLGASRVLGVSQSTVARRSAAIELALGVTMMADFLAVADPALVRCFTPDLPAPDEIWLLTHEKLRQTPRVRAAMDFFGDYFAKGRHKAT